MRIISILFLLCNLYLIFRCGHGCEACQEENVYSFGGDWKGEGDGQKDPNFISN